MLSLFVYHDLLKQGVSGRVHCTQETYQCIAGTTGTTAHESDESLHSGFRFVKRAAADLRASSKFDGSYTKQTYFVERM